MNGECPTVKFPDDARAADREPETDEEIVRRQPVRGMIRRMMRNHLKLVPTRPAQTPFEIMAEWAEALPSKPRIEDIDDLAGRPRGARLWVGEAGGGFPRAGGVGTGPPAPRGRLVGGRERGVRLFATLSYSCALAVSCPTG